MAVPVIAGTVTGTEESLLALFNDTAQVGTDGRQGADPLVIPVYVQLPVSQVGKGIYREITLSPYFVSFLVQGAAGNKLAEQAGGGQDAGGCGYPDGNPFQEIPPGLSGFILMLHQVEGCQKVNLLSFFMNYSNRSQHGLYF
jgi:hypothetical protein